MRKETDPVHFLIDQHTFWRRRLLARIRVPLAFGLRGDSAKERAVVAASRSKELELCVELLEEEVKFQMKVNQAY